MAASRIVGVVLFLFLLLGVWWAMGDVIDEVYIQELADTHGLPAFFLLVGLVALTVVATFPALPVTLAIGAVFGAVTGIADAMVGACLGALLAFLLARFLGRDLIASWMGGHIVFCPACSDRVRFWVVLVSRLVPVLSFALVSYLGGLTAMRIRAFLAATAVGMLPMTVVYVVLGA